MSPLRATCPYCAQVTRLAPAEILLALHAGARTAGDYAYTCPQCLRIGVHAADQCAVATLLAAGVRPLQADAPPSRHPEAPPAGPPLTYDDVLSIHALLNTNSWFEHLLSLS